MWKPNVLCVWLRKLAQEMKSFLANLAEEINLESYGQVRINFRKGLGSEIEQKKSFEKNGPHLSCDLHKIGANIHSKLAVAPFCAKKYGP